MIATPRLVLREWRDADLDPFAALTADARVMEFFPATLDRAQSAAAAARYRAHFAAHGFGFWAIDVPGIADFVGFCGLMHVRLDVHFAPCVEIGWRLRPGYWGHGYASEAARGALDYGFTQVGLREIVAYAVEANTRSRRVMERLGMTHDPADDFDHPMFPEGHRLRRHILYRCRSMSVVSAASDRPAAAT